MSYENQKIHGLKKFKNLGMYKLDEWYRTIIIRKISSKT